MGIISIQEFQKKLDWLKECHIRVIKEGPGRKAWKKSKHKTCDVFEAFIDEKDTHMQLVMKEPGHAKAVTYKAYLDGEEHIDEESITPAICREFLSYYKPKLWDTNILLKGYTSSAILGCNPKFNSTRHYAYEYDVNSAYSYELLKPIPDTSINYGPKVVEDDEFGYNIATKKGKVGLYIINAEVGEEAIYVFKKMESPWKKYVKKYYELKKVSTGKERILAKARLNIAIGNLQNHDPFIRAQIINSANKRIADLIDENTLYWNTDAIVSTVRRPDIEKDLGIEIGQWKLDKEGQFAYIDYTYQWDDEIPGWRGIPKSWFAGIAYDLLKNVTAPPRNNPYVFDWIGGRIVKNEQFPFADKIEAP